MRSRWLATANILRKLSYTKLHAAKPSGIFSHIEQVPLTSVPMTLISRLRTCIHPCGAPNETRGHSFGAGVQIKLIHHLFAHAADKTRS